MTNQKGVREIILNALNEEMNLILFKQPREKYSTDEYHKERLNNINQALSDISKLLPSEKKIHKYLVTELSDEVITSRVMDVFKSLAHSIHTLIKERMGL